MIITIDSRIRDSVIVELKDSEKTILKKVGSDPVDLVKALLTESKLKLSNIEKVELVNLPGSFTGLKIGASAVNTLNLVLGNIKSSNDLVFPNYGSEPNITPLQKLPSS
ncbi:hypothetical protein L6255_02025 [Candidatus Parcubacteria bacterium]|nr:hypothetical protein [Patescibacteria group bacterium]MCG2689193.1 hypothetical protein [Candidatus Parcubacteria bacterium]